MSEFLNWLVMLRYLSDGDLAERFSKHRVKHNQLRCTMLQVLESFCKVVDFVIQVSTAFACSFSGGNVSRESYYLAWRVN